MYTPELFPGYRTISIHETVFHRLMQIRGITGKPVSTILTELLDQVDRHREHPTRFTGAAHTR